MIDVPLLPVGPQDKVATAGSCFAQNIANALQASGFHYFVAESGPTALSEKQRQTRNYGIFGPLRQYLSDAAAS
ncbi:MAG: GSCFA domain-containing protein, partial [Methylobacteriaceae bacterium]|nr:GSCFA domain-containing protein [Methylobacteriaceae bacterium]